MQNGTLYSRAHVFGWDPPNVIFKGTRAQIEKYALPAIASGRKALYWRGDLGHDIKVDASIAKVYATEVAAKVVDRCIQIFGALGIAQEMPLER